VETLRYHFEEGGWIMGVIAACLFGVAAIAIDRAIALARARGPATKLVSALEAHLRDGDLGGAIALSRAAPGAVARAAQRILLEALTTPARLEAAREVALLVEVPRLWARAGGFAVLANLATLFGLLGTVTSVFVPIGCVPVDARSRAVILAKQISEGLTCTWFGLFVAASALTCVLVFRSRIEAWEATLRAESKAVVNLAITYRERLRLGDARARIAPRGYRRAIWDS